MIPKKIHYCWFGGGEIPQRDKKCIESWSKYCPDYEIIKWDESNYDVTKNRYMKEAYDQHVLGFVPDYARLDIIYQHGGIYLDTDVELVKSLEPLLKQQAFMGVQTDEQISPGLGFGAEKNSPTIKECMEQVYGKRRFIKENGEPDILPSPHLITEYFLGKGWVKGKGLQEINGMVIYPKEYFCPMNMETKEVRLNRETYSIHHFHASWVDEEEKRIMDIRSKIYRKYGYDQKKWMIILLSFPYKVKRAIRKRGILGEIIYLIRKRTQEK